MTPHEPTAADGNVRLDDQGRLVPAYGLYTVKGVTWATFFGSPLAGGIVMAINYGRLGLHDAQRKAIVWSVLGTLVLCGILLLIPEDLPIPNSVFYLPQIALMYGIAHSLQGPVIDLHRKRGGVLVSVWRAIGIGCICLIGIAGSVLGVVFAIESYQRGTVINFNVNDDVYYSGQATEQDALLLGKFLTEYGYFGDLSGASVQIKTSSDRYAISFVLIENAWEEAEVIRYYEILGNDLANAHFGRPLTIHLCDEYFDSQRSLRIE